MKKISKISLSILLVSGFLFSCKKENKKCDNGLDVQTYTNCNCPDGYAQLPNNEFCIPVKGAAGKFVVGNMPNGFYEEYSDKIYFDIKGTNFLSAPWGETSEVIVGLMENSFTISKIINTEAIAYYITESKDSFMLDFRKLPHQKGYNKNGEGLLLTGTLNSNIPNLDWKWQIVSDSVSITPISTIPAELQW